MSDVELHITNTVTGKGSVDHVSIVAQLGRDFANASGTTTADAAIALLGNLRRLTSEAAAALASAQILTLEQVACALETPGPSEPSE